MKHILHNSGESHFVPTSPKSVCIAGPFTAIDSKHQWRRLTLEFDSPPPAGMSIEVATMAHEAIDGLDVAPRWITESGPLQDGRSLHQAVADTVGGVFRAVIVDDSSRRTQLLDQHLAFKFARVLGFTLALDERVSDSDPAPELEKLMPSIRRYPMNATDVTIWHLPGHPQKSGTQLWILMRIGLIPNREALPQNSCVQASSVLKSLEVESQEFGWERDLPQIYQESNPEDVQSGRAVERAGMPILLESLLRLFEFNTDKQREEIQRNSDWYVPSKQTTDINELARHLGIYTGGLEEAQLLKQLQSPFQTFLKRGTTEAFLGALRDVYSDSFTKECEKCEKWGKILGLQEPIRTCRVMVLDDPQCRLGDPNVVLSGVESHEGSDVAREGPALQLTGLRHLVGRAILRVNAKAFPEGPERDRLRQLVDRLAPAYMRIVIQYVGAPAIVGFGAIVGESTVG